MQREDSALDEAWRVNDASNERAGLKSIDRRLAPEGYVYFIKAGDDGPVKIGWAQNPQSRLDKLQMGNHLVLKCLGSVEGTPERERHYHKLLKKFRIRGEWFEDVPELRSLMSAVGATACRHTSRLVLNEAIDRAAADGRRDAAQVI